MIIPLFTPRGRQPNCSLTGQVEVRLIEDESFFWRKQRGKLAPLSNCFADFSNDDNCELWRCGGRKPRGSDPAPARPGVVPPPRLPPPANPKLVTWYRSLGASLKSRLLLRVAQHFTSDLSWFPFRARSNKPAKLAEMCGANARGVHSVTWMWTIFFHQLC